MSETATTFKSAGVGNYPTLPPFDIRDHEEKLTPTGKPNRYECPVCGGNDLTIDPENGAYQCWHGCKCEDIRNAIAPLPDREAYSNRVYTGKPKAKKQKLQPAPIPKGAKLAKLPADREVVKSEVIDSDDLPDDTIQTLYYYSKHQYIKRLDIPNKGKRCEYWHKNERGEAKADKGDKVWRSYRIAEIALLNQDGRWITGVEGEGCVESLRDLGLPSTTWREWTPEKLRVHIRELKKVGVGGIFYLPDNDQEGRRKANAVTEACHLEGMPVLVLEMSRLWPEVPQKGDIKNLVELGEFSNEELAERIEAMFEEMVAEAIEIQNCDPLKLDIQAYLMESDPFKQVKKRTEILTHHQIDKADFKDLTKILEQRNKTPELKVYNFTDLLNEVSEGLDYLVPGMMPRRETILCVASPKTGKTLLAIDLGFAVATGSEFLGHQIKQGKVLIISVDESLHSTKAKLIKRGFRPQDTENLRVIASWDISQMLELEAQIEDFRPDLIIVDSLKRITLGSELSENSAEFADSIYKLKELFTKYGAAGLLIHHSAKGNEHAGVDKARGSSAIAGATWGQWQLEHIPQPDPDNPKKMIIDPRSPHRTFYCYSRDTEGEALKLFFNPDSNSFENLGQKELSKNAEKENQEEQRLSERILNILKMNEAQPLSGRKVIELLGLDKNTNEGRAVYSALSRLTNKRIITQLPAAGDKRFNLYSLPSVQLSKTEIIQLSQGVTHTNSTPPPPPLTDPIAEYSSQSCIQQCLQDTQQNTQQILSNYSAALPEKSAEYPLTLDIASHTETLSNIDSAREGGGFFECSPPCDSSDLMMTEHPDKSEKQPVTESILKVGEKVIDNTGEFAGVGIIRNVFSAEPFYLVEFEGCLPESFESERIKPAPLKVKLKGAINAAAWEVQRWIDDKTVKVRTGNAFPTYSIDELEFI